MIWLLVIIVIASLVFAVKAIDNTFYSIRKRMVYLMISYFIIINVIGLVVKLNIIK